MSSVATILGIIAFIIPALISNQKGVSYCDTLFIFVLLNIDVNL